MFQGLLGKCLTQSWASAKKGSDRQHPSMLCGDLNQFPLTCAVRSILVQMRVSSPPRAPSDCTGSDRKRLRRTPGVGWHDSLGDSCLCILTESLLLLC